MNPKNFSKNIAIQLGKGDEVRFKNNLILYFQNHKDDNFGWFKENHGSTNQPKMYRNVVKINGKPPRDMSKYLKEEISKVIEFNKNEVKSFEEDPLEYILNKYPSFTETLIDLMSPVFRDYITGIYIISPKPTTFKILLHNGQSFYMIFNPKSYICNISGKKYMLMNIKEKEYAIKAISRLLLQGSPSGSAGPEEEMTNETNMQDSFVDDMTSEPQLDDFDSGNEPKFDTSDNDDKEELQENEIETVKKFRIVKRK